MTVVPLKAVAQIALGSPEFDSSTAKDANFESYAA